MTDFTDNHRRVPLDMDSSRTLVAAAHIDLTQPGAPPDGDT